MNNSTGTRKSEDPGGRGQGGGKRAGVALASGIVIAASLVVALTELLREGAVASQFGATRATDIFAAMWILPSLAYAASVYIGKMALVPLVTESLARGEERSIHDLRGLLGVALIAAVGLGGLLSWVAYPVAGVLAPGLEPEARLVAGACLRLFGPYLSCGLLASIFGSVLQARRRFAVSSGSGVVPNLCVMVAALISTDIRSLCIGFSVGSALQVLVLWGACWHDGIRLFPRAVWPAGFMRAFARIAWAPCVLVLMRNLAPVVDRMCTSFLGEGAVAQLNYSYRLVIGARVLVAGTAFTVSIPFLAALHARGDTEAIRRMVQVSVRAVVLIMAPLTAGLWVFGPELVGVLLMRGEFGPQAAQVTGHLLAILALTLLPESLMALLSAPYYARQEPTVPLKVTMVVWPLHLVVVWPMARYFGLAGVAWTAVAISTATAILMGRRLRRDSLRPHFGREGGRDLFAAMAGAIVLIVVALTLQRGGQVASLADDLSSRLINMAGLVVGLGLVYLGTVVALTRRSPRAFLELIRGRTP